MSVGIVIKEPLPSTDHPETTADKRLNDFMPNIDWEKVGELGEESRGTTKEVVLDPGLDTQALSEQYGLHNAHKPVLKVGTFNVPTGINQRLWESFRLAAIRKFLRGMSLLGWEHATEMVFPPGADRTPGVHYDGQRTVLTYPGVYPAHDLRDGIPLLDQREYRVAAHFRFRNPKPKRILVPPELLAPTIARV